MVTFRKIAVASDFGPSSKHAVDVALDLAAKYDAELTVVHVVEPYVSPYGFEPIAEAVDLDAIARETLDEALTSLRARAPALRSPIRGVVLDGRPAPELA